MLLNMTNMLVKETLDFSNVTGLLMTIVKNKACVGHKKQKHMKQFLDKNYRVSFGVSKSKTKFQASGRIIIINTCSQSDTN